MQLEVRCDADASFAVDEGVSVALSLGSVLTSGGGKAVRAVGPPGMGVARLAQRSNHIPLHVEHVRTVRMRLPAHDEVLQVVLRGIQFFVLQKETVAKGTIIVCVGWERKTSSKFPS